MILEEAEQRLSANSYPSYKRLSKNRLAVLTDDNRIDAIYDIIDRVFCSEAFYDPKPTSQSSIGCIKFTNSKLCIYIKPASKQGASSSGLSNEFLFLDRLNETATNGKDIMLISEANARRRRCLIRDFDQAAHCGKRTSNRQKADIILQSRTGYEVRLSLKQDNAQMWESAETLYGERALATLKRSLKNNIVNLYDHDNYFRLSSSLAIQATPEEIRQVVLGSDLREYRDCILTRTFGIRDFTETERALSVTVTDFIDCEKYFPNLWFLIRNDRSRRSKYLPAGLRVLAVSESRLRGNVIRLHTY